MPRAKRAGSKTELNNGVKDYRYNEKRRLIPEAGLSEYEKQPVTGRKKYAYDPHLTPQLQWSSKRERQEFQVDTVSLHIHERISTKAIIDGLRKLVPASTFRKIVALPLIGAVIIWDLSGVFYWTQQVVAIYNGPGFLSLSGMLTFAIISFVILFVIGIVSAGAEWVLKHIVPEWFRGKHKPEIAKNRPSYVVMGNIPLAAT